jgi:hypothetical protein
MATAAPGSLGQFWIITGLKQAQWGTKISKFCYIMQKFPAGSPGFRGHVMIYKQVTWLTV